MKKILLILLLFQTNLYADDRSDTIDNQKKIIDKEKILNNEIKQFSKDYANQSKEYTKEFSRYKALGYLILTKKQKEEFLEAARVANFHLNVFSVYKNKFEIDMESVNNHWKDSIKYLTEKNYGKSKESSEMCISFQNLCDLNLNVIDENLTALAGDIQTMKTILDDAKVP